MSNELTKKVLASKPLLKPEIYKRGSELREGVTRTSFNRYPDIISFLRRNIRESIPKDVDILDVGIGYKDGISFEPIILAGICEVDDIDYSLTLLDNSEAVLKSLKKQRDVRISESELRALEKNKDTLWRDYSSFAGALPPQRRNHSNEEEIFHRANLPPSYQRKIKNGQIKFVVDDISTVTPKHQYDLVFCMRVLEHVGDGRAIEPLKIKEQRDVDLNVTGISQACAVYNLVESVKPKGYLCVDELWRYDGLGGQVYCSCATEALIKLMYRNSMEKVNDKISSRRNSFVKASNGRGNYSEMVFKKVV